jgi:hypothetical protein
LSLADQPERRPSRGTKTKIQYSVLVEGFSADTDEEEAGAPAEGSYRAKGCPGDHQGHPDTGGTEGEEVGDPHIAEPQTRRAEEGRRSTGNPSTVVRRQGHLATVAVHVSGG